MQNSQDTFKTRKRSNSASSIYMTIPLKETQTSRHIKVNATNIALLLQEATQKYRKLTDY